MMKVEDFNRLKRCVFSNTEIAVKFDSSFFKWIIILNLYHQIEDD